MQFAVHVFFSLITQRTILPGKNLLPEQQWQYNESQYIQFQVRTKSLARTLLKYKLKRTDLKNTTDDALPNCMTSLKFKQSHYLTDVRLALGYSAVVIAAITFAADYKYGWDATKAGTFWAVIVYFLLNGAFTLWLWQVEKGVVFSGEKDGTQVIDIHHFLMSIPALAVQIH